MFGPSGRTVAIEKKERDGLKVVGTRKGLKGMTVGRCLSHNCSFMWALRLWPILSSFTGYISFRKAWEILAFDCIKEKTSSFYLKSFIPWFIALRKGFRHLKEGISNSCCTPALLCKWAGFPLLVLQFLSFPARAQMLGNFINTQVVKAFVALLY